MTIQKKRLSLSYHSFKAEKMELSLTTTYQWEREPGEEITLHIGGTHYPAGQHTEYDQPHGESTVLDWIEDASGNRLAEFNFSPEELEGMRQRLIEEAERQTAYRLKTMAKIGKPTKGFLI